MKIICLVFSLLVAGASAQTNTTKTYILIHGAWHAKWCWQKVVPLLESSGGKAIAIDLPGHGLDTLGIASITLEDYVSKVVAVANGQEGPVILVGHSMAGVVIAQAAEVLGKEKVASLVFLDAFMPKNGESVSILAALASRDSTSGHNGPSVMESLEFSPDHKLSRIKSDALEFLFYHDCSDTDKAFALRNVGWQPMACLSQPVVLSEERYGSIPKYYILCSQAHDLNKQSLATHVATKKIYTLESSHSPFLSMPQKLVEILISL